MANGKNGGGTEVAVQEQNPKTTLVQLLQRNEKRLENLLPKHLTPERMMSLVMLSVSKTPKLLECDPHTVVNSVMQAATAGLEIGGPMARAHLVPFWNGRRRVMECQMIPDYRGLIQLAIESGALVKADARVAYEGEHFEVHYGTRDEIIHVPNIEAIDAARSDFSKVRAVYFVARLPDGSQKFEVMTRAQIEEIKDRSQASSNGPWVTDPEEMAKKTVTKRGLKYLPGDPKSQASRQLAMAIEADNRFETGRITMPVPEWDDEDGIVADRTEAQMDELKARMAKVQAKVAKEKEQEAEAGEAPGEAESAAETPPAEADLEAAAKEVEEKVAKRKKKDEPADEDQPELMP